MRKPAPALALILAFSVLLTSEAKVVQAGYEEFEGLPYDPPIVAIESPSIERMYVEPDIPLNVTVKIRGFVYHNVETIRWLNYSLDSQTATPMTLNVPSNLTPPYSVYASDVLTGLTDGTHNVTVYGETAIGGLTGDFNVTVSFRVDTTITPITEKFPTTLVISSIITGIIVLAGLILYNRRRRKEAPQK